MKEKERYKVYSYRLNDGTAELFKKTCNQNGISYNRLLYKLLEKYEQEQNGSMEKLEQKKEKRVQESDYNNAKK